MSVDIDIDLKTNGATGKIGAIAASLKGLERVAKDIEIDFDADIGNITDEIEAFSDALEGIDMDMNNLGQDLKEAASDLDNAEVSVVPDSPDGSTNQGDSTGGDPPSGLVHKLTEFGDNVDTRPASDGGSRANLLERTYGEHTLMSESDVGDLFKTRNSAVSNLGESAPGFSETHQMKRLGTRTGFGLDSEAMNLRRMADELSFEDFAEGAGGGFLGERKQNKFISEMAKSLAEAQYEALANVDAEPFGGVNTDLRDSELDLNEQFDISTGIDRDFASQGNPKGDFISEIAESFAQAQYDALNSEGFGGFYDRDFASQSVGSDYSMSLGDAMEMKRAGKRKPDVDLREAVKSPFDIGFGKGESSKGSSFMGKLGKSFRKLKPTMSQYMELFAAIIPVAIALGAQLMGVAAAMGSVAAAGGAIMGLGLLGHGETLAGSMAEAKQQMRDLKQEMFNVVQPTAQQFAPIQARMFDSIPQGLNGVFEEMEGLTAFEDTLFRLGGALGEGLEETVAIVNRNEAAISSLSVTFGRLIGSGALDFFEGLIQKAAKNRNFLIDLGGAMISLIRIVYNVSMAIGRIVETLTPVITALEFLSGLLNNKLVMGLLSFVTVAGLTAFALTKMGTAALFALSKLGILGSGTFIGSIMSGLGMMWGAINGLIAQYTALTGAALKAASAMAATGVGLLAVGGGLLAGQAMMENFDNKVPSGSGGVPASGGMGGGGGKTVYNDNRSYQFDNRGSDYASQKATEDAVKKVNEENSAQSLPPVTTTSETSDGEN